MFISCFQKYLSYHIILIIHYLSYMLTNTYHISFLYLIMIIFECFKCFSYHIMLLYCSYHLFLYKGGTTLSKSMKTWLLGGPSWSHSYQLFLCKGGKPYQNPCQHGGLEVQVYHILIIYHFIRERHVYQNTWKYDGLEF